MGVRWMCLKMCIFGVCAIHQPILPGINLEFCNLNTLHRLVTAISDEGGGDKTRMVRLSNLITATGIISTPHTHPVTTQHNIGGRTQVSSDKPSVYRNTALMIPHCPIAL